MMRYDYSCMRAFLGEIDETSPTPAARENKRRDMAADMQHRRATPNTGDMDCIHPWIGLDWWGDCDIFEKNFNHCSTVDAVSFKL